MNVYAICWLGKILLMGVKVRIRNRASYKENMKCMMSILFAGDSDSVTVRYVCNGTAEHKFQQLLCKTI